MTKIRFQAFGKVTVRNAQIENKGLDKLYEKRKHLIENEQTEKVKDVEIEITEKLFDLQRSAYEDKLKILNEIKNNKGNQAALFKLKARILGEKKAKQEAVSMENPESGEMLFEPNEIKEASTEYLVKLLTNRKPNPGYERDIETKEIIHKVRMKEDIQNDDTFTDEDFGNLLKNLRKKNKEKYQSILKAGTDYLRLLYSLFQKIWNSECKPQQWELTVAHQLYKGKGRVTQFLNQRFIHTKNENPKAFEHIIMAKAKPKIVDGCSKYQIGALPKHRSQEHLFTLKSTIGWYSSLAKPVILQLFDISKFFDREMLKDGMDSLYNCGVNGKLYRLIYEMNRSTVLTINTGCGTTQPRRIGANITQGSIGGALISSVNLDMTVNQHFGESQHEISYVDLRLQPTIFQDDISRLSSNRVAAQAGNEFIKSCMEVKLLDLNVDKSCYIIIGNESYTADLRCELKKYPLELCGNQMKEKLNDKYLGDILSFRGLASSAHETIMDRYGRVYASIVETRAIVQDCRSQVVGGITAGLDIWETAHIPSLLNNCENWIQISDDSIEKLEDLQNTLYRMLLSVPRSTPVASLAWDLGGVKMKYRIIMKKLLFLHHLVGLDDQSLAKQVLSVQDHHDLPGLVTECKDLIVKFKLPNILKIRKSKNVWKSLVKKKIIEENSKELKEELSKYRKLEESEFLEEEFGRQPYTKQLDLASVRTKFKFRTKMTQYVKMNFSNSTQYSEDLWRCDSCRTNIDSQNHVLWCGSYASLREGKDMRKDEDLCTYLQEVFKIRHKLEILK